MTIQDHPAAQPLDATHDDAADFTHLMPAGVFTALLLALVHSPVALPTPRTAPKPERPAAS